MEIYKSDVKTVWFKAAVLGSIWASFEIVFGSFLHNIRFPMSGTILTILAVIIVITFSQIWKEKGIVLRAGIIAALMKAISPSAVLIGPMTGIFMEAVLIEISFFVFGKNYFSYLIAGVLALYSVFIHKIITLLILYGTDIVQISENLYYFVSKQLNIQNIDFVQGLLILSLFYIIVGITASVLGIFIGKKSIENSVKEDLDFKGFKNNFISENEKINYSVPLIFVHLLSIIGVFITFNFLNILFASTFSVLYVTFSIIKYKKSFKHFKKIGFWIQILLLLIISVLFYSGTQNISLFNKEGLLAGTQMILRMFVLFTGFTAISFELRNPLVRAILFRRGLANLYQSMGLAFSVLPEIIERNTNPKLFLKNPVSILTGMVNIADSVFNSFINQLQNREVIIISGQKNKGKTTFVANLIKHLKDKNISVQGITALGVFEKNEKIGFNLQNIENEEQKHLCSVKNIGNTSIGRFYFDEKTIQWGNTIIENIDCLQKGFVIVDEIGPLELKNKGWSESVEKLFLKDNIKIIWVVRKSLVKSVLRKFAISSAKIIDIEKDSINEIVNNLLLNNNNMNNSE